MRMPVVGCNRCKRRSSPDITSAKRIGESGHPYLMPREVKKPPKKPYYPLTTVRPIMLPLIINLNKGLEESPMCSHIATKADLSTEL